MSFFQLTPHLWVTPSRFFHTNSGLFISQDRAALIDPCLTPDEIAGLARFVREQGASPQWLILTHSHWDHILGPEHFPGVKTVAQRVYVDVVERDGAGIRREIEKWEAEAKVERRTPFVIPHPEKTFDETLFIEVGQLALRLSHAPGHAPDQLVAYHADSATLWASDILSDVEIPFVSDSLAAYERTLAQLATWEIGVLVPGHGHPTDDPAVIRARLAADGAYLAELRDKVERAVREGRGAEAAVADCAAMMYRRPEANEPYHRLNVESAYLELGGQADPRRVGWRQDGSLKEDDP